MEITSMHALNGKGEPNGRVDDVPACKADGEDAVMSCDETIGMREVDAKGQDKHEVDDTAHDVEDNDGGKVSDAGKVAGNADAVCSDADIADDGRAVPLIDFVANTIRKQAKATSEWYENVTDKVSDVPVLSDVASVTDQVAYGVRHGFDATHAATQRLTGRHGYADRDLWELGTDETRRIADYLRHMANMSFASADLSWYEHLTPCADAIGTRDEDVEALWDLLLLEPFGKDGKVTDDGGMGDDAACGDKTSTDTRMNAVRDAVTARNARFDDAWDWVGRNVMTEAYNAPQRPTGALPMMVDGLRRIGAKALGDVTFIDETRFPVEELYRIASMLRRYVNGAFGYPDSYLANDDQLKHRGDDWGGRAAIWYMFVDEEVKGKEGALVRLANGSLRNKTNDEIGRDYAAWSEDLLYAADVFEAWAKWLDALGMRVATGEAERKVGDAMRDEFVRCWDWFGRNATAIWW